MPLASFTVRLAAPGELAEVGRLTTTTYAAEGLAAGPYLDVLGDAARRAATPGTEVLVAVDDDTGAVLGAVTYARAGTPYAQLARDGEAEFRMLVTAPASRRRGVGQALVSACLARARRDGATALVMSTHPASMVAAQRLYGRLGFERVPERDWSPLPGVDLAALRLRLHPYCDHCGTTLTAGSHEQCRQARRLEPPRFCPDCGRRMVVQVLPAGWSARCVEHGVRAG